VAEPQAPASRIRLGGTEDKQATSPWSYKAWGSFSLGQPSALFHAVLAEAVFFLVLAQVVDVVFRWLLRFDLAGLDG